MIVERWTGVPLHRRRPDGGRPPRGPATAEVGLLLVGHGSRCPVSADQMHRLGDQAQAARPDRIVEVGFLEMTDPPAGVVLDSMVARGCRRIVVLPLMLLAAGHTKSDVPAIVVEARQRHPQVEILFGSPFGVAPELVAIGAANLAAVDGHGLPLMMVARGTSDPAANAEAMGATRLLAEWTGTTTAHTSFTGMTWPSVPLGLDELARLATVDGMAPTRLALFFWFLGNGKLIERARGEIAEFSDRTGIEVIDAGYFGPDPGLVEVILRRGDEAEEGVTTISCDSCVHRAPFPGHEAQLGRPIGVGHSHLAADHRHSHGHGGPLAHADAHVHAHGGVHDHDVVVGSGAVGAGSGVQLVDLVDERVVGDQVGEVAAE